MPDCINADQEASESPFLNQEDDIYFYKTWLIVTGKKLKFTVSVFELPKKLGKVFDIVRLTTKNASKGITGIKNSKLDKRTERKLLRS